MGQNGYRRWKGHQKLRESVALLSVTFFENKGEIWNVLVNAWNKILEFFECLRWIQRAILHRGVKIPGLQKFWIRISIFWCFWFFCFFKGPPLGAPWFYNQNLKGILNFSKVKKNVFLKRISGRVWVAQICSGGRVVSLCRFSGKSDRQISRYGALKFSPTLFGGVWGAEPPPPAGRGWWGAQKSFFLFFF